MNEITSPDCTLAWALILSAFPTALLCLSYYIAQCLTGKATR